jgi:hypothetical protein
VGTKDDKTTRDQNQVHGDNQLLTHGVVHFLLVPDMVIPRLNECRFLCVWKPLCFERYGPSFSASNILLRKMTKIWKGFLPLGIVKDWDSVFLSGDECVGIRHRFEGIVPVGTSMSLLSIATVLGINQYVNVGYDSFDCHIVGASSSSCVVE